MALREVTYNVHIIESEAGWGAKIDEVRPFDTKELADAFVTEFNSKNTAKSVPDWYMYAEYAGTTIK